MWDTYSQVGASLDPLASDFLCPDVFKFSRHNLNFKHTKAIGDTYNRVPSFMQGNTFIGFVLCSSFPAIITRGCVFQGW